MEYTPRIGPDEFEALQLLMGGGALVSTIQGHVTFDLSVTSDFDLVSAGIPKPVTWSGVVAPQCAFAICFEGASLSVSPPYAYDIAAECTQQEAVSADPAHQVLTGPKFWLWGNLLDEDALAQVASAPPGVLRYPVCFGYEGPPVVPNLWVRSGMIIGTTNPAQAITFNFELLSMPMAELAQARISIPSPFSCPPFIPTGTLRGTHIFSAHPTNKVPGAQPYPIPRVFRTKTQSATLAIAPDAQLDAQIFGGPWNVEALVGASGVTPGNVTGNITQLPASSVISSFEGPVLDVQSGLGISLKSGRAVDAARVAAYGAAGAQAANGELLLTYP